MAYRYRITPEAAAELEREMAYSARNWGKRHAKAYRQGLMAALRRITENPYLCREQPDIGAGYRLARYKGNWIVYCVNEAENYIEIMGFPSVYRDL